MIISHSRPEEAAAWAEKARVIDEKEQEKWSHRVAESIVASPWGANEAAVDQLAEQHKKELALMNDTHSYKRLMMQTENNTRMRNFRNTILAEERKVRMQCKKQAQEKVIKNFQEELREQERLKSVSFGDCENINNCRLQLEYASDGLKNVSVNTYGKEFTEMDRKAVDWKPPTTFGLDNSVRLADQVNDLAGVENSGR